MPDKPVKPYAEFPLTPHSKGWYCTHNKRTRFVCNAKRTHAQALVEWERRKPLWDAEDAGKAAPAVTGVPEEAPPFDVARLCELWVDSKAARVAEGGMKGRTLDEYDVAVRDFAAVVGPDKAVADLTPSDFQKHRLFLYRAVQIDEKRRKRPYGPHRRRKHMSAVRSMFKWGVENDHLPRPPKYGTEYTPPGKAEFRRAEAARRREHGKLYYPPEDLGTLLAATDCPVERAMILLALNCGLGQEDISTLDMGTLDLDAGLVDGARQKNWIARRAFLWPESVTAGRAARAVRPDPRPDLGRRMFLTPHGNPWVEDLECERRDGSGTQPRRKDALGMKFLRLNRRAGVYRVGRNFYSLRRTCRTSADEVRDHRAAALVMGHEVGDVADLYVEDVSDARLRAVTDHVRTAVLLPALEVEAGIRRERAALAAAGPAPLLLKAG